MPYIITGPVTMGTTATNTIINGGVITVTGSTSITDTVGASSTALVTASYTITSATTSIVAATTAVINSVLTDFTNSTTNVIHNFVTTAIGDLITTTGGSATTLGRIPAAAAGLVLTSNGVGTLSTYQAVTSPGGSAGVYTWMNTATQSIPNTGVLTAIASFGATTTVWTHPVALAGSTYTVPATGIWFMRISLVWDNSTDNSGLRQAGIFKSNATTAQIALSQNQPAANDLINYTLVAEGGAALTAGDTVVFQAAVSGAVAAVNVVGLVATPGIADLVTTVLIFRLS